VSGTRPDRSSPKEAWLPKRALVVGLARSGRAAAAALARRGVNVVAADRSPDADSGRLGDAGVEIRLGTEEEEALLAGVELVVKSPGVPAESPPVAVARQRGIPIWSEVELGYRLLPPGARLIGVTGTNGKTTTTELLGAILRADGREVEVAGNVGRALTDAAEAAADDSWIVCELSSFQLEDVHTLACDVAVLLNLEPDHLDRHGTFEAYRDAKLRIFERARARVVPRGFGIDGIEFSADDPLPAEPLMPGRHNRENAAAATAVARLAGIDNDATARALRTFPGVRHRLELVAEVRGVRYVNDSKATNVAAARRALEAYADAPVHLIAGGRGKGESFRQLAEAAGPNVRTVYALGETAAEIAAAFGERAIEVPNLAAAVERAAAGARAGDVVLLSPACASYDQYENFEERGEEFRRLVQNLTS
jgi:UDP-N-acetylmuramoylalanine--D-glutamate ligase